jgi:DNA repair exonuclease SbcCD ATPase subunit/DNA repair exonuclease SbcCD nuclease subunit
MTKLLKRAALFTDIHFGKRSDSDEHNNDCMAFVEWFMSEVQKDPEIDHIWFLGDWHEHRAAVNAFTLDISYRAAKKLNSLGIPIYHITGNHDMAMRNKRTVYTTNHFENLENYIMVDEIKVYDEIHGSVLAIPYLTEEEYPEVLKYPNAPVAMGHLELKGFKVTGTGNVMEHGPEASTFFKDKTKVFSGHFHQRQSKGNIHYIGNPFAMNFSDANDPDRGMAVYDFETDTLNYINWEDGPRFIRTTLSDVLDNPKSVLHPKARVKIDVDEDITFTESNAIKEQLANKFDLREITLEEKISIPVELTEIEQEVEQLHLESTSQIIKELIRRIKPDGKIDIDLILKIFDSSGDDTMSVGTDLVDLVFLEQTISNYQSYGADTTVINLNFADPTLILGRNLDSVVEGQVDSNGSGKSTILNALLLALYGKNLVKASLDKQINKSNGKNMLLTVTLKANNVYYRIERYRKNRAMGGDGVRLYRNYDEPVFTSDHDITKDSIANTDKFITSILGIPYEMAIRICVFSATHEPFLSLPSSHASQANQRDIIEELFGLTELTTRADNIKEKVSDAKRELELLKKTDEHIEGEYARHAKSLEDSMKRLEDWEVNRTARVEEARLKLSEMLGVDLQPSIDGLTMLEAMKDEISSTTNEVNSLEKDHATLTKLIRDSENWEATNIRNRKEKEERAKVLSVIPFAEHEEYLNEQKTITEDKVALTQKRNVVKSEISSIDKDIFQQDGHKQNLEHEIEHLKGNTCPYCSQNYAEAKEKMASAQATLVEVNAEIERLRGRVEAKTKTLIEMNEFLEELEADLRAIADRNIPSNLAALKAELDMVNKWLEENASQKNPFDTEGVQEVVDETVNEIAEAKARLTAIKSKQDMAEEFILPQFRKLADIEVFKTNIENTKVRIVEIEKEANPIIDVVDGIKNTVLPERNSAAIDNLDHMVKHYNYLVKLLTKKDSFIRKALLNRNIPLLNSRLRYYLDHVGMPHQIAFNDQMGVDITQYDASYEYEQLSTGQKARVNICLAFAFQDVLQSRFGKMNLRILDECLDGGLGTVGSTLVARMVRDVAIKDGLSMFVISHKEEISSMFARRLEVELKHGFSSITQQG